MAIQVLEEFDGLVSVPRLQETAEHALEVGRAEADAEVSVVIAGDDDVRELNRRHRGLDETTDVLSFSYLHHGQYYGERQELTESDNVEFVLPPGTKDSLGEVIISYPQAQRQASEAGHTVERELAVLLTHGILHLLGHDHEEPREQEEMESVQAQVLSDLRAGASRQ